MSRHRCRITLLMARQRLIWFTTESLLVQRGFGSRRVQGERVGGRTDGGTDKPLSECLMSLTGKAS